MSLATYLAARTDRCPSCLFHVDTQGHGPACIDSRKQAGITAANDHAAPDDKARVDAEIRRLAATGRPFSANDMRHLGVTGPVVGGRFSAAHKAGLIKQTGARPVSNLASTNGHEIKEWIAA